MSRRKIKAGSTSISVPVFILDTSSTVGAGLGSLVYNTSNLAAKYRRQGDSAWTTITLQTMTVGTWASGGFIADGGPITGGYEIGIPNAALAANARWVEIVVYGAANMLPVLIEIELDTIDYQATGGKVPATIAAGDIATDAISDTAVSALAVTKIQTGLAVPGSAMTLTPDYDAAKSAASAGAKMDLIDSPNSTAMTAIAQETNDTLSAGVTLAESQPHYSPATSDELAAAVTTLEEAIGEIDTGGGGGGGGGSVVVSSFEQSAMNQLSAKCTIVNMLEMADEKVLRITSGDEISDAMGNNPPITLTGNFPDITGWTVKLFVERKSVTIEGQAEIVSSTTSTIVFRPTLSKSETIKLESGKGVGQLRFFNGSDPATMWTVPAIITKGLVRT